MKLNKTETMSKDLIIATQAELITRQKDYINWVNKHTPQAKTSRRGKDMLTDIKIIDTKLASLQVRDNLTPDYSKTCEHAEKYRFTDKDGQLRCSDCHEVVNQALALASKKAGKEREVGDNGLTYIK